MESILHLRNIVIESDFTQDYIIDDNSNLFHGIVIQTNP